MHVLIGSSIGRYQITLLLGVGGMGEVYRAEDRATRRTVALKVLRNMARDPVHLQRFYNESRIQAKLYHPNIAALLEVCETPHGPCIVMEYIPGATLAELIQRDGAAAWPDAARWFHDITRAVGYLHANHIVHRDITLNNVKLTPDGTVKLLDFGLARDPQSAAMTQVGTVAGTTDYLSPEQITRQAADARSDVWSLGVLFHAMLTGDLPFQADGTIQLWEQLKRRPYPGLKAFDPTLPDWCDAVVSRCLRPRPGRRFQNAGEIANRLDLILSSATAGWKASPDVVAAILGRLSCPVARRVLLACGDVLASAALLSVLPSMATLSTGPVPEAPLPIPPASDSTLAGPASGGAHLASAVCGLDQPAAASLAKVRISSISAPLSVYCHGRFLGQATSQPVVFMAPVGITLPLVLLRQSGRQHHVSLTVAELNNEYSY